MKTTLTLLIVICIQSVVIVAGAEVEEPVITISGHYRSSDGRVKEHNFPVEIKLLANGKFTGIMETWLEERLSDGSSHLEYVKLPFTGSWKMKSQTIFISIEKGNIFPSITFPKINGLNVVITNKKS